ncbi:hypothetical protein JCM3774_005074 [Rhodotorula dairenensis]
MPAPATSTASVLSASLSLVVLQVVSRLFSFALNQLLLRSTSPQAFGVATIQLDTLVGTVLFFLREGIRGAVARAGTNDGKGNTAIRRQTFLIPTLLAPVALLACAGFYSLASPAPPPARWASTVLLYSLSVLIELASEPLYLRTLASWQTLTTKRVKVEGFAIFVKAVATLGAVRLLSEPDALLAFGIGQLAYSTTIWVGLYFITRAIGGPGPLSLRIKPQPPGGHYFEPAVLETGWALTKQSVIKQVLTEADKLAVGRFGSSADMGGYAVALNYGSLIARVVFQPLEESSRLYFASLAAAAAAAPKTDSKETSDPAREAAAVDDMSAAPPLSALVPCASYLRLVLFLHTHLALIFVLIAPKFTTPLLHLLLGSKWSRTSAAPILRAYAYSLPFMGLNGITEAFFQAVASPRWIQRGAAWMVVCAAAFATTCWIAVQVCGMGARGLIVANCVNMALRTAFSSYFMVRYFSNALSSYLTAVTSPNATGSGPSSSASTLADKEDQEAVVAIRRALDWRRWTPSLQTVSVCLVTGYIGRRSESMWEAQVMDAQRGHLLTKWEEVVETWRHSMVGFATCLLWLTSAAWSNRSEFLTWIERRQASSMRAKQE